MAHQALQNYFTSNLCKVYFAPTLHNCNTGGLTDGLSGNFALLWWSYHSVQPV